MENTIQFLKKTLEEKDQEMQIARCFVAQTLEENEAKWRNMLSEKGKQITNFETKLSNGAYAFGNEILALKQRSRKELIIYGSFSSNFPLFDSDTNINITEVFLELYKQLKLSVKNLRGQDSLLGKMTLTQNESCFNISELSKDAGKIDLKELTTAIMCNIILLKKSLETKASSFKYDINSQDELDGRRIRANNAFQNEVRDCSLKENISCIEKYQQQVESEETNKLISDNEKSCPRYSKLELETEAAYLHSKISSNCSIDFPDDMKFHDLKKDSQNLMSKDVVRNLSFESSDDEDNALFGLKVENVQLFERMLGFEAEMRHLIEEKESTHLALENYENVVKNLQAEIRRMEALNESQKVELKRKWESMQKKWI
ncbi:hypothetical protein GmHk_14G040549 [Glycine max]|nr:hypothetical protein GmHk_14G040549 [Glycine max]